VNHPAEKRHLGIGWYITISRTTYTSLNPVQCSPYTMPTYAILGATGQTGSELLTQLIPTSAQLNIYARSSSKLALAHPNLPSNVTPFIGDLSNTTLLQACIQNADIIFSTVAQNQNEPGCSIAQQTALALIKALEPRRLTGDCPTVIFLASGAVDPAHQAKQGIFFNVFYTFLIHIYTDLEKAIKLLQANPWIPVIIACPGGLVHDTLHKVELVGDQSMASGLLSYKDLAAGMRQMADDPGRWEGKYVGMRVNEGEKIGGNPASLLRYLLPNILGTYAPFLWRLGRGWWPV
jgi:hypothetical protein